MKVKYYCSIEFSNEEDTVCEQFDLDFEHDHYLTYTEIKEEFYSLASELTLNPLRVLTKVYYTYKGSEVIHD